MVHTLIGDLGHTFVIISFITSLIASFSYWKLTQYNLAENNLLSGDISAWKKFARGSFYLHAFAVLGVVISLFVIIYNHYYEYHYAWSHSSNNLPAHYMISCFWEGQEGSFLLWIFWHVVLGVILINVNKTWEAPIMTIFCLVQAFLASMIIGVVLPGLEIKIGSSPFILLKDYMGDIPVYKMNPDFVPENGTGLNPLLQNYWMVIHPPTLFLGFASTLVPFVYCMAGLWQKKYSEWIRPALPWALFSALVLGVGILMGGYWAYETLNFGGYWNWDPVENAVYVPWLVLVGSIHTMIIYKNSNSALNFSVILVTATFILILYSTFLTRSGILGDSSVHSFTDLGLSGQLLIYLLVFFLISLYLIIKSWGSIPATEKEISAYSREFWIFIGAIVLCLASFQVWYTTSIPVYNSILSVFGLDSRIAPPADPMIHYSKWQIWAGVLIAFLSGIGQFFWWKKMDNEKVGNAIAIPLIVSLLLTCGIVLFRQDIDKVSYILLLAMTLFSITANLIIAAGIWKNNYKLSGGAVAHIGVAMMLLGILFSSGYSKVVSLNTSGLLYSKEFSVDMNRDNILLWRNDPLKMGEFELTYKGPMFEARDYPGYIKKENLFLQEGASKGLAKRPIYYKEKLYFHKGDSVEVLPENTYYEVSFKKESGDTFTLYPRAQVNPQMGLLASPDIKRFMGRDLYSHVSSIPAPDKDREWSKMEEYNLQVGDTFYINDYVAMLDHVEREQTIPGVKLDKNDAAVMAHIKIFGKDKVYRVHPVFIVLMEEKTVGQIPEVVEDIGVRLTFLNVDPKTGKFTLGVNTTQKDYIILKALEKPLINVLWIGTFVLIIGLLMAIFRRYSEFSKMRDKGLEV